LQFDWCELTASQPLAIVPLISRPPEKTMACEIMMCICRLLHVNSDTC
jgi:hypothetical protein